MQKQINYTKVFHTVPILNSEMVRNTIGNKCDLEGKAIRFEEEGWSKYTTTLNTNNTPLLGAIAGQDFIGVDIDYTPTYLAVVNLLDSLNLRPTYLANSLPIELGKGGHLIFSYNSDIVRQLKVIRKYLKKDFKIDIQVDNSLIYLATPHNYTKQLITEPLTSLNQLTPFPPILLNYLKGLVTDRIIEDLNEASTNTVKVDIGDIASTEFYGFILDDLNPEIVSRVTPKRDYKDITHMNQIPEGAGTDWMLQVRKKLQIDSSVSEEVFLRTMEYLNSLWHTPMDSKRIVNDVSRDIKSPDFKYNPNWRQDRFLLTTIDAQHTIEVLYLFKNNMFIIFNRTIQEVDYYTTFTNLNDALIALTGASFSKEILLKRVVKVTLDNTPEKLPFINDAEDRLPSFNIFIPSEGLQILRGEIPITDYRDPSLILDFFSHLIPDKPTRELFLRFIACKHCTYNYSPLYFVQSGVAGAGKGILVNKILKYLSGNDRVTSINLDQLTSTFNSYLLSTDWLELDEAGEGLTRKESEKLVAGIKKLTGSSHVSITKKGVDTDDASVRHYVTPILAGNLETKLITDSAANDRRMVLLRSPTMIETKLPYNHLGKDLTDMVMYLRELEKELPLFAKYLSILHENNPISPTDYINNRKWKGADYYEYLDKSLSNVDKLRNQAGNRDSNAFAEVLEEVGVPLDTIDKLFSLSEYGQPPFVVIYNTAKSQLLGVPSLEDVMQSKSALSNGKRRDFSTFKEVLVKRIDDNVFKLNIISFDNPYEKRLGVIPNEKAEQRSEGIVSRDTVARPYTDVEMLPVHF